ncbi:MAG: BTAD domain-containing putative transcriptional regulator, partial [Chthoniobacteraceae bacterium]
MRTLASRSATREFLMALAAISGALLLPVAAAEPALITEARRALSEQIPQAAIVKLQAALADATLGDADRLNAGVLLAEAQLHGGRANDAIETLSILNIPADTHARQLRALALSSLGRWSEALALFRELNAT